MSLTRRTLSRRGLSFPPRPLIVLAAVIPLVLGVMSAVPVQATPSASTQPRATAQPQVRAQSTARPWQTNQSARGSAALAPRLATPPPLMVAKDGEVPSLRTRASQTFARGGRMQTVLSTAPVNYRDAAGAWAPIDDTLVKQADGSYHNAADDFSAAIPARSTEAVVASRGGVSLSWLLVGSANVPVLAAGSRATFAGVLPGVDAVFDVRPDTVEQTLRLADAAVPRSYAWTVTLSAGLSLRPEKDRSVAVVDGSGKAVGSLPAPVLRDSSTDLDHNTSTDTHYTIAGTAPHYTVTVSIDGGWLSDPARVFPVLLDPSTVFGTASDLGCYVASPGGEGTLCSANTGTDNPLVYGSTAFTRHIFAKFGDLTAAGSAVPADAVIDDAALTLTEQTASSPTTVLDTSVYGVTAAWTSAITWAAQPSTDGIQSDHLLITPPGVNNSVTFHTAALVRSMISTATPGNDGFEVKLTTDAASNSMSFYGFANTAHHPTLTVTWQPQVGQQPWIGSYAHSLSDRMGLQVDYGTRNLVLGNTDEQLAGPGQSMSVRRSYNSLSAAAGTTGAYGPGWTLNGGTDVSLNNITNSGVEFTQPGGAHALFPRNFAETNLTLADAYFTAPGLNASLSKPDSTHYTLTFNKTKAVDTFTLPTTASSTGWLSKVADSDGNTLTYAASGTPLVTTSLTDTTGQRSLAFTYTSGKVTSAAETLAGSVAGRSYGYAYDSSGRLSTYTDPAAKITRYCYSGTSNLISKIITPHGTASGATCTTVTNVDTTDISYDATGRVNTITYEDAAASPTITVTFSTPTTLTATVLGVTRDTDPFGKNTDYSYDSGDRVEKVIDPLGNTVSSTFNTNNNVTAATSANNDPGGPGLNTAYTYDTANINLLGVTLPKVGTNSPAGGSATYAAGTFLPQTAKDDLSSQTNYTYNAGNHLATALQNGATLTIRREGDAGVAHCGPSGAAAFKGAVCETRDPNYNAGVSTTQHRTLYTYDALGELVSITGPTPGGTRTTPPATVISYDKYSRPYQITDGNSHTTTYTYDTLDRPRVMTLPSGNTFEHVYDQDGGTLSASDYTSGHSLIDHDTYSYDPLNRTATKTNAGNGAITLGWDSNSRLLTYTDPGGTVTYGYDSAGGLTSIAEPGGSCTGFAFPSPLPTADSLCTLIQLDKSGNRLRLVNPGDVAEQDNTYDTAGRVTEMIGKGAAGAKTFDYTFAYTIATQDTAHVTSRTDTLTGNITSYGYTPGSRLTTAVTKTSGGTVLTSLTYCYDLAGNRLNAQTTVGATCPGTATFTYDGANQLLTQPYGSHAAYDLVGNETDIDSAATGTNQRRQADYSSTNQVQDQQIGTGSLLNQTYLGTDNTERLISNISTTDNQALLNTPLGISASTRSHSGTPQNPKYYTRDPNGNLISMRLGSTHYYYQTDNQQSVVKLLDDTGATKDSYSYDPYGQPTATETVNQPFGYTSGWLDSYSGLLKLGARYYDPTLGRFTQPDPSGQEANTYNYASCNPVNGSDPTGLFGGCDVASALLGADLGVAAGAYAVVSVMSFGTTIVLGAVVAVGASLLGSWMCGL